MFELCKECFMKDERGLRLFDDAIAQRSACRAIEAVPKSPLELRDVGDQRELIELHRPRAVAPESACNDRREDLAAGEIAEIANVGVCEQQLRLGRGGVANSLDVA